MFVERPRIHLQQWTRNELGEWTTGS